MGYTPEYIYIYIYVREKKTISPEMGGIYQFFVINGWCNISGETGLEATIITRNGRYIFFNKSSTIGGCSFGVLHYRFDGVNLFEWRSHHLGGKSLVNRHHKASQGHMMDMGNQAN